MTEKEALVYQQNCEEFRSLNGFFWNIPLIMMTLNGGLWYSVASLDLGLGAQRGMLAFAVVANLVMVVGLQRIRSIMEHLLESIRDFQETEKPPGRSRVIQVLFQGLLSLAAFGALVAAFDPPRHFTHQTPTPAALSAKAPLAAASEPPSASP